jgi:hypothetical protein
MFTMHNSCGCATLSSKDIHPTCTLLVAPASPGASFDEVQTKSGDTQMTIIENGTKHRLILGGGERLEARLKKFSILSATCPKLCCALDKPGRTARLAGTRYRALI